jgi:hypothetical protein
MLRRAAIGALLLFAGAAHAQTVNPNDLEFRIRVQNDAHAFHTGERIVLEYSYYSESVKKYKAHYGSAIGGITMIVTPGDGVVDLSALANADQYGSEFYSVLSSQDFVDSKPFWNEMTLTDTYRFEIPGHYSVAVTSTAVRRVRSADEGGGTEEVTLQSNPVEFEILPPDENWNAAQLAEIERGLAVAKKDGSAQEALRRLEHLDTPASVAELLRLYLTGTDPSGWIAQQGLIESSHTEQVIGALKSALADPTVDVPRGLPELLARIETRAELGAEPERPADEDKRAEWENGRKERRKTYNKYVAAEDAVLLAGTARRSGPNRATAIFDAWESAENRNDGGLPAIFNPDAQKPEPETLARLRRNVLEVMNDLTTSQLSNLVGGGWSTLPHEQLLPAILKLTDGPATAAADEGVYEHWCQDWPSDCNAKILKTARDSLSEADPRKILLLAESEHAELDSELKSGLESCDSLKNSKEKDQVLALVMRVGSRNLVPSVNALLDEMRARHENSCDAQPYLLAYLFRFRPDDAGERLKALLLDPKGPCSDELLQKASMTERFDAMLPSVRAALGSPSLRSTGAAAVFLGNYGTPQDEEILWKRLDTFESAWRARSHEVEDAEFGTGPAAEAKRLEEALASALSNATNWKLSDAELERLREGCLTSCCRDIVDNKMWLGF